MSRKRTKRELAKVIQYLTDIGVEVIYDSYSVGWMFLPGEDGFVKPTIELPTSKGKYTLILAFHELGHFLMHKKLRNEKTPISRILQEEAEAWTFALLSCNIKVDKGITNFIDNCLKNYEREPKKGL
jgi:hypothetical protein